MAVGGQEHSRTFAVTPRSRDAEARSECRATGRRRQVGQCALLGTGCRATGKSTVHRFRRLDAFAVDWVSRLLGVAAVPGRNPQPSRARCVSGATINVPGFHVTTWFDIFQTSVVAAFTDIHARVGNQRLWIGPNAHYFVYERQFWPRDPYFEWFDHWLKGVPTKIMEEPAVFYSPRSWIADTKTYVANDWRHADHWPPSGTVEQRRYLTGDGRLSADGPRGDARSYLYDPHHPIPTRGGRNMLIDAGPQDQRPVRALPNYGLIYLSEVLDENLTIAGAVSVTLHIQSNCRDTDFVAKLIELQPDGSAMLLMDGVVRAMYRNPEAGPQHLTPEQVCEVKIHLGDIHHTFQAGCRLQVDITSSNFPRRARNTNSGNAILANDTEADIHIATNVVHHSKERPSFLLLPCLPSRLRVSA
jgi:putative CocE/NonD family hydrolase